MATKPRPGTYFPTPDAPATSVTSRVNKSSNCRTEFPRGIGLQPFSTRSNKPPGLIVSGSESSTRAPSRLPLAVKSTDSPLSKPVLVISIQKEGKETLYIRDESPWSVYNVLYSLERGSTITAVYSKNVLIKIVAVKCISPY
jgi:hypothetical protein